MFMRKKETPTQSYITLEIRGNTVVQQRRAFNKETSEEDNRVICKFNRFLAKQNKKLLMKTTKGKTIVQTPTKKLVKKVV